MTAPHHFLGCSRLLYFHGGVVRRYADCLEGGVRHPVEAGMPQAGHMRYSLEFLGPDCELASQRMVRGGHNGQWLALQDFATQTRNRLQCQKRSERCYSAARERDDLVERADPRDDVDLWIACGKGGQPFRQEMRGNVAMHGNGDFLCRRGPQ